MDVLQTSIIRRDLHEFGAEIDTQLSRGIYRVEFDWDKLENVENTRKWIVNFKKLIASKGYDVHYVFVYPVVSAFISFKNEE